MKMRRLLLFGIAIAMSVFASAQQVSTNNSYPVVYIQLSTGELWNAGNGAIAKEQFEGASLVVEYIKDGVKADLRIESFSLSVPDGMGGYRLIGSDGNKFSNAQIKAIQNLASGSPIILTKICYTGIKTGKNMPFEPLTLK